MSTDCDAAVYATIETRPGDDRAIIRLSGTAGLDPGSSRAPAGLSLRTQRLCESLMAMPEVTGVEIVRVTYSDAPKRNIVVHWQPGSDAATVTQQAWAVVREVLGNAEIRRAFWRT